MNDSTSPQSSIFLDQTEDGRTRIQCRFEDQLPWLTQALIAGVFQTAPQVTSMHLRTIPDEKAALHLESAKARPSIRDLP